MLLIRSSVRTDFLCKTEVKRPGIPCYRSKRKRPAYSASRLFSGNYIIFRHLNNTIFYPLEVKVFKFPVGDMILWVQYSHIRFGHGSVISPIEPRLKTRIFYLPERTSNISLISGNCSIGYTFTHTILPLSSIITLARSEIPYFSLKTP